MTIKLSQPNLDTLRNMDAEHPRMVYIHPSEQHRLIAGAFVELDHAFTTPEGLVAAKLLPRAQELIQAGLPLTAEEELPTLAVAAPVTEEPAPEVVNPSVPVVETPQALGVAQPGEVQAQRQPIGAPVVEQPVEAAPAPAPAPAAQEAPPVVAEPGPTPTDFAVYKGAELPKATRAKRKDAYPFDTLELHDLFFVANPTEEGKPSAKKSLGTTVSRENKRYTDRKFVTHKMDAGQVCGEFTATVDGCIVMRVAAD